MINLGIVIIGRNEGERLIRCIQSLREHIARIIYVDSASTDNSVKTARELGVHVVNLDMSQPFTAARARNVGFENLIELHPKTEFIQFVDGDCEVLSGWLETAAAFLQARTDVAVVNGILDERFPEKTIYNTLCDLEWKMQAGEVKACGGNALMRVSAFKEVKGFLPRLIAGEEPELCVRLRAKGWKIWHLHQSMMLHDANITQFGQWWKRAIRAGYAFAEGAHIHGAAPEFHWVAESKRAWRWGFYIPLVILITSLIKPVWGLILLLVYPLQVLRLSFKSKQPINKAFLQSFFFVIGKFAEVVGHFKFLGHHYTNKQGEIIEYK